MIAKKRKEERLVCVRCSKKFDGVIEEEDIRGVIEQLILCPNCNYKHSIIFYDEMLDDLIHEYNEFININGHESNNQIVNYKKKIVNLINYLKSEAERRSDFRGSYIKVPEEFRYLIGK